MLNVFRICSTACLLLQVPLYGAVAENLSLGLEEVVVTGTRTDKRFIDSPVKMEVITRLDIERKHARDLREVLVGTPGIDIQPIHGKTGYQVWLQGMDSDRVLVLMDGERVAASTGSSVDLTQIATADIERVEIVKGATSALYGSSAIGGVINVITRKPEPGFAYELRSDFGSFDDKNPDGKEAGSAKRHASGALSYFGSRVDVRVSANINDMDGMKSNSADWDMPLPFGHKSTGSMRLGYALDDGLDSYLCGSFYDEDVAYRYQQTVPGQNPNYYQKDEKASRERIGSGIHWQLGEMTGSSLRYAFEKFDDSTAQDNKSTLDCVDLSREAQFQTQTLSNQWDFGFHQDSILTLGFDYYQEDAEQTAQKCSGTQVTLTPEFNGTRQAKDLYLQHDFSLGPWEFLPGVRFQNDSDFGNHAAPKINGKYKINQDASDAAENFIRFGIGEGYRVPNLKERHFKFDHSHIGYMVFGNPDLEAEQALSYQLGWVYSDGVRYRIDLNLFRNELKDLITTSLDTALTQKLQNEDNIYLSIGAFSYDNIARARTQGFEFTNNFLITETVEVEAGYQYLDARDLDNDLWLKLRPRHQFDTSLVYRPVSGLYDFSLIAHWQSEEYYENTVDYSQMSPSWRNVDFKFNYYLLRDVSLYAGVDNMGDEHRDYNVESDIRNEQPRFVYLGFRLKN